MDKILPVVIARAGLQQLIEVLIRKQYRVLGPVIRDGAIVYGELTSLADLPAGWTDEQEGGRYRLRKREDAALFGYTVGPQSCKKFLFPPEQRLWNAKRNGSGFDVSHERAETPRFAFLGVRACELAAVAVQDKVFLGGSAVDPDYRKRRENSIFVAVNCGQAGKTCFCASMNTGPRAVSDFDLALTEILEPQRHCFLVEVGSPVGADLLQNLPHTPATEDDLKKARDVSEHAARQMGRQLDTRGLPELLYQNAEHPEWEAVARRCLTCANCTMVCPTCFCHTVEDVTDLAGDHAERWRKWDSCFTMDFSYIFGGSVRPSTMARYRQWMTHKLAYWIDQFGTSGCVGCGRCITWCPVGIDLTEEVRILRETAKKP